MNQAKLLCKWDYVPVGRVVGLNKEYLDLGQRIQTTHKTKSQILSLQSNPSSYDPYYFSFFFLLASHRITWLFLVLEYYGIVIYHWRVREGLPFSIYSAIFSENCKIDQNSNLTPVKVLAAHSCKTKNWWSSTLTFPKIAFLHGGDWLMSVIRNRLHVAMGVISHRWQKTSKCGKNIRDTLCCALHDTSCFCHILTSSVTYFRREN